MTDREKLVKLIGGTKYGIENRSTIKVNFQRGFIEKIADHLIAHGVTVQGWIPVTERLPERTLPPKDVLVYHDLGCGMFVDRAWYSYDKKRWCSVLGMKLKVTHWMPLPEPPKGE
jgi:hypothetical protein